MFTTQLPIAGAFSCFSPWLGWDFDTLWILPLIRDHPIWSQIQNVESSSGDSIPAHYRSWVPASRQPVTRCAHQHHRPPGLCQLPHLWKTLGWQLYHQEREQEIAGECDCLWRWSRDSQLLLGMPRSAGEKSTSTLWILWGEHGADGRLLRGTRSSEMNVAPSLKSHFIWIDHKDQQTNDLYVVGFSLTPILFAWTLWDRVVILVQESSKSTLGDMNIRESAKFNQKTSGSELDHNDPSKPSHRLTNGPEPWKPWKTNLGQWKTMKTNLEPWKTMKNQPRTMKNQPGTMKNH